MTRGGSPVPRRARQSGAGPSGFAHAWRSQRQVARVAWRVCAGIALTAGVALAILHVWIFWDQLSSGRLLEGGLAMRWAAAAGLLAALGVLRRRGVSLWWGRKAFSVWLLVALLHAWSAGPVPATTPADPIQDAATFLLPLTAAGLAGLTALMLVVGTRTRRSPLRPLRRLAPIAAARTCNQWDDGVAISRGPPLFLA